MSDSLTNAERARYVRQLLLFGEAGQLRLKNARVLVLGAGGLGSAVVPYLAAAGVGTIGVVDDDVVEASNLHRQVMHDDEAIGAPKAVSAALAAARLNPGVRVVRHLDRFDASNADELVAGYDLVVDGFDTFAARFAASDAAERAGIPHVWGAALGYDGQVAVFDARKGVTLRTLFPAGGGAGLDEGDSCSTVGVLGPVCAAVGGVMAAETIKLLTGTGTPAIGKVLVYDALDATWREIRVEPAEKRPDVPEPAQRPLRIERPGSELPELAPDELRERLASGGIDLLIDLREPDEIAVEPAIEGAVVLPFSAFMRGARPNEDYKDDEVVVYCAHGVRSQLAGETLLREGWRITHLAGGIDRWYRG